MRPVRGAEDVHVSRLGSVRRLRCATFRGCAHAAALNLQRLRDPSSPPESIEADAAMAQVQGSGHAHEGDYL